MPLSPPAPRAPLHRRAIDIRGFQRDDGLFDIEAQLTDTKTYALTNRDRGTIAPGVPLHGMWVRLTVDEDLMIVACEAQTDFAPYSICPQAAPNFSRLAGVRIGAGFNRAVHERVGGTIGCTHLREVLGQMATTAYQTLTAHRMRRDAAAGRRREGPNPQLGTCLAYAPDSPVVLRDERPAPVEEPVAAN